MPTGTKADPFTAEAPGAAATYRCWRFCKCSGCGEVKQCTPDMDFYYVHTHAKTDQPLVTPLLLCDPCHNKWLVDVCGFSQVFDQRPLTKTQYERGQKREGMN